MKLAKHKRTATPEIPDQVLGRQTIKENITPKEKQFHNKTWNPYLNFWQMLRFLGDIHPLQSHSDSPRRYDDHPMAILSKFDSRLDYQ